MKCKYFEILQYSFKFEQAVILNELLASGMTYEAWLLHMINVQSDADIAVAKSLRYMLQVTKQFFSTMFNRFVLPKRHSFEVILNSMRQFFSETVAFQILNRRAFQNSETVTISEIRKLAIFPLLLLLFIPKCTVS